MITFVAGYFTFVGLIVLAGTILSIARDHGIVIPGKA
jgi:hypothetical protein